RTEVMERRLKLLEEKNLFRTVDREKYSMLFDFYDIETAVDTLIKNSAGVYFFQSDPDPDGLQRKYPLVGIYENRIFPSASLAIALKHYGVAFDDVEIIPGKHLRFDLPKPDEHGRTEISIPINAKGQMQVNWAGNWEDPETGETDLIHYDYSVLKRFQKLERRNYILSEFKKIINSSYGGKVSNESYNAAKKYIDASDNESIKIVKGAAKAVRQYGQIEKLILKNPKHPKLKQIPKSVLNELTNNNIIADEFSDTVRAKKPT
ncbi:uncharacterized protein METZ01_LOCUS437865, partial [marine metagenome]